MPIKSTLDEITSALQGIYSYNFLRHFKVLPPTELQIIITYWCNARCTMCNIWKMKPKNELSFNEWQQILKDPIFSTINRLLILGGEPLLHPRILDLVKLYINSMPKLKFLDLTSNGFLPLRTASFAEEILRFLKKRRINFSVTISIDGVRNIHDDIRGPHAFDRAWTTVMSLKNLQKKYNFNLGVAGVIMRRNLHEIEKLEKLCQKHNIPFYYQIVGFRETYLNNMDRKNEVDFRKEDQNYLYKLLEKLSQPKTRISLKSYIRTYYWKDILSMYKHKKSRTTPCSFTLDAFSLDSFGNVYYCTSQRKIGNCRKSKNVSKIYYDKRNVALRKSMFNNFCLKCNSQCFVTSALAKDFKKLMWYFITGRLGPKGTY